MRSSLSTRESKIHKGWQIHLFCSISTSVCFQGLSPQNITDYYWLFYINKCGFASFVGSVNYGLKVLLKFKIFFIISLLLLLLQSHCFSSDDDPARRLLLSLWNEKPQHKEGIPFLLYIVNYVGSTKRHVQVLTVRAYEGNPT